MDDELMRCARCGRSIDPVLAAYLGRPDAQQAGEPLCPACAEELALPQPPPEVDRGAPPGAPEPEAPAAQPGHPHPRPADEVLEEILREVKHVVRNLEYDEFSIWNIFGGLVQCVVLFLLFWHYFKGEPDLMWAVAMQLLALTLFVMAKK